MRKSLLSLLSLLGIIFPSLGRGLERELAVDAPLKESRIIEFSTDGIFTNNAVARPQQGKTLLSSEVLPKDGHLYAGLGELPDGELISSALYPYRKTNLNYEEKRLKVRREEERLLSEEVQALREKHDALQEKLRVTAAARRKEVGLDEIDNLYGEIQRLDQQLLALKEIQEKVAAIQKLP